MVYAQGGAIASPSTADTDQPTGWMSSATACMQASGSRLMPSAIASHSAHRHRSSGGLARRLRGGFMPPRYEGGTTFSGARAGRPARRPPDSVPGVKWLAEPSVEALREALKSAAPELSADREQFGTADSGGRCNALVVCEELSELLAGGVPAEALAGPVVELVGDGGER